MVMGVNTTTDRCLVISVCRTDKPCTFQDLRLHDFFPVRALTPVPVLHIPGSHLPGPFNLQRLQLSAHSENV